MRNSTEYAGRLLRLCRKLRRSLGAPAEGEHDDPVEEIVLGFFSSVASEAKALTALNKVKKHFVDFNELRVCRDVELVQLLGSTFPQSREVGQNIVKVLQQIFDHNDSIHLGQLRESGKREAKTFLEKIEGLNAYVTARVMLLCLEAHAFPVHKPMLTMLRGEEVVAPDVDEAEVQGFLERQIPAKDILKYYLLLRKHADRYKGPETPVGAKKITVKKTVKKKAVKKKSATKKKPVKAKK